MGRNIDTVYITSTSVGLDIEPCVLKCEVLDTYMREKYADFTNIFEPRMRLRTELGDGSRFFFDITDDVPIYPDRESAEKLLSATLAFEGEYYQG